MKFKAHAIIIKSMQQNVKGNKWMMIYFSSSSHCPTGKDFRQWRIFFRNIYLTIGLV